MLLILAVFGFGLYIAGERISGGEKALDGNKILEAESSMLGGEYNYVPADRLPPPVGGGHYRWNPEEKIVRFSYDVWIGWLPLIAANHGTRASADSIFFKKYGFRVEMVLMSDPAAARKAFAAGDVHTLWGTVDMMVLHAEHLMRDARAVPRIVQQIDWSSGGDGLVARNPIRTVKDLRDKTIALAKDTSSFFYMNWLLLCSGMQPADLRMKYTATTFEAAAALVADKGVDACVSRAPDMHKIPEREKDLQVLDTTGNARRLLADVYAVRADFSRDHPEVVRGLIAGIFEGMDYLKQSPEHATRWMADAFVMAPEEILSMRKDAQSANFGDNSEFFLNAANPTNFERTWKNASRLFRELGRIQHPVAFDSVMDFTWLKELRQKGDWNHQRADRRPHFTPSVFRRISPESSHWTQGLRIGFAPNSKNPFEPIGTGSGNKAEGASYDPNAEATLMQAAMLAGQLKRPEILIEGHVDSSMKGTIPADEAYELSLNRAESVRRALIERFSLNPYRIRVQAKGWDAPADPDDWKNQALNRRVEIFVFEAGKP
jgi:ABC-type nitrate/sulfonate/bicarbonate transport system substrate-binding protein